MSSEAIRARACGLLSPAAASTPGGLMSSTKQPRPRSRRGSSFRATRAPIIRVVMVVRPGETGTPAEYTARAAVADGSGGGYSDGADGDDRGRARASPSRRARRAERPLAHRPESPLQPRSGPRPARPPRLDDLQLRGPLDQHGALHPDLHA